MKYIKAFLAKILGFIKLIIMPIINIARRHPIAFSLALIMHFIIATIIFYNSNNFELQLPEVKVSPNEIIEAVVINEQVIRNEEEKIRAFEKQKAEELAQMQAAALKAQQDKAKAEQEKIKAQQDKTKAEQEKIKAQKKAQEEYEKKLKTEKEREILEQEIKKTEKEKKETEKELKRKQELAKIAQEEARKAEDKKNKLDKDIKIQKEKFDLEKSISEEELQDIDFALEDQVNKLKKAYISSIAKKVRDVWLYNDAKDDWGCDVYILQNQFGEVQMVNIQECYINDDSSTSNKITSFKNSIERAVYKASPLPQAPDLSVFDTEIIFYFKVN